MKRKTLPEVGAWPRNYNLANHFRFDYKDKSPSEKLKRLIELSEIKLEDSKVNYGIKRDYHYSTRKPCYVCGRQAYYHHHIILLKNGGYASSVNRIPMCEDCHKKIHPWLELKEAEKELDRDFQRDLAFDYT